MTSTSAFVLVFGKGNPSNIRPVCKLCQYVLYITLDSGDFGEQSSTGIGSVLDILALQSAQHHLLTIALCSSATKLDINLTLTGNCAKKEISRGWVRSVTDKFDGFFSSYPISAFIA